MFRGVSFRGAVRVGLVALSAVAAAVVLAGGVLAAKQWLDTVVFNQRYYASLKASQVDSFASLVERFEEDQLRWAPLLPPCEKPLVLSEQVVAADFALGGFDKEALAGLVPAERLGVTVYPVLVIEDPLTRARVVTCGESELARIPAPPDYDPLWPLAALCGDAERAAAWRERSPWMAALFDSSRIVGRYALLSVEDLSRFVALISATSSRKSVLEEALGQRLAMRSSVEELTIAGLEQAGTGMVLTIDYPDGFTNNLDIFGADDLIAYWWSLLGTAAVSTATTSIVWTDTDATNVVSRYYRIGVADIDGDEDGYSDAREELMYHSDPEDGASYPVTVSGMVTHSNTPQTGQIIVVAVKESNSWDTGRSDLLASPGAFAIEGVPNLADYWIRAWRDWCPNGVPDAWEATGMATNCPVWLSGSVSNLAITLHDPSQSISGTLSYTGRQTGLIYAVAVTASNSMDLTHSDALSSPGAYAIGELPQTSYWARAWIDADADGLFDADREASGAWTNNPIALSNSVWAVDFSLTDVDADSDGMPDWWELANFDDTNQTAAGDYDGDQMPNLWEYTWNFCPTNAADAMEDFDGDGYPNVYEYKHDSNPHKATAGLPGEDDAIPAPTITVTTNGAYTLQSALDAATGDYAIVLVEPGVYTGSGNRDLAFPSHPVLLIGEEGAAATVIDCQGVGRGASFPSQGDHIATCGLTVRNGSTNYGAGFYCPAGSSPLIASCAVEDCSASQDGGGLYASNATPTVLDCAFVGNAAGDDGGGLRFKDGAATVGACLVEGNECGDNGGGLYASQSAVVEVVGSTVLANRAGDKGGGIGAKEASLCVRDSWVERNSAIEDGGGISLVDAVDTVLEATTVERNKAQEDGGGLRLKDSAPLLRSCLFLDNQARDDGGGLYVATNSAALLLNCTFLDNRACAGTGHAVAAADASAMAATNGVFWSDTGGQLDAAGFSAAHSVVRGGLGGTGNSAEHPRLSATGRLSIRSPCIGTGTNTAWMSEAEDIDGEPRLVGACVDRGADEFADSDDDGLSDAWELAAFGDLATASSLTDSDGDGLSDLAESAASSDPLSSATGAVTLTIGFGDLSNTTSEWYRVSISNATAGTTVLSNSTYGVFDWFDVDFQKGQTYVLHIEHVGTDPYSVYDPDPDYDYEFYVEGQMETSGWFYGSDFIIDNTNGVLGKHGGDDKTDTFDGTNGPVVIRIPLVDIVSDQRALVSVTNLESFCLSEASDTNVTWTIEPAVTNGPSIAGESTGTNIEVWAGAVVGVYTVRAESAVCDGVFDTAVLRVIESEKDPAPGAGSPIDPINGAYAFAQTDFAFPCAGPDLAFTRTYNSRFDIFTRAYNEWNAATNAPLGPCWTHNHDWFLDTRTNCVYRGVTGEYWRVLSTGDGYLHWFRRTSASAYASPVDSGLSLSGNVVTFPNGLSATFDTNGVLQSLADDGQTLTLAYDSGYEFPSNRLASVAHSGGLTLKFDYGVVGGMQVITNVYLDGYDYPRVALGYDTQGRLTSASRTGSKETANWTYAYGAADARMTAVKTPLDSRVAVTYVSQTNAADQVFPVARTFKVNGTKLPCTATVEHSTLPSATETGSVDQVLFGGTPEQDNACSHDLALRRTGAVSVEDTADLTVGYDGAGRWRPTLLTQEEDKTLLTEMTYESEMPHTVAVGYGADPGDPWVLDWSSDQRIEGVEDPDGHSVAFAYSGVLCTGATASCGASVGLSYSGGLLSGVSPSSGPAVSWSRDALGFADSLTVGDRTYGLDVDELGRLWGVTHPGDRGEAFSYDAEDNLSAHVDLGNRTNTFERTPEGALSAVKRNGATLLGIEYQEQFGVVTIKDALSREVERYTLDPLYRTTAVRNLEGQTLTVGYTVGGYAEEIGRFDGTGVTLGWSESGQLASTVYPDDTVDYAVAACGLLEGATDSSGSVGMGYNPAGNLTSASCLGPAGVTNIAYTPNAKGQTAGSVSVAGASAYAYDGYQATGMSNAVGQFSFEYSGERTTRVELPGGVHATYEYDHYDRVSSIEWRNGASNLIERFAYSYNGADMGTQVGRVASTNVYTVDGTMDRLLGETVYNATGGVLRAAAWTYDAVGNRTSASNAAGTATYSYVSGCNRLASFGSGTSVGHDPAGCVTSIVYSATQTVSLAWDGRYRLTEAATNGVMAETYGYDALNRRAWTSNATEGLVWHIYDGWQVVADVDATGGVLRTYSWMPGKIDRLLSIAVPGVGSTTNVYCAITDQIGTVHALTDTNGVIVESYVLDAWGQILSVLDASSNAIPRSALGNRYLFQGREYSWATGLYSFRNRWYDPVTGRWLSKDPIGISGGLNQYVFCANNPVNFSDPDGENPVAIAAVGVGLYLFLSNADTVYAPGPCDETPPTADASIGMLTDAGFMAAGGALWSKLTRWIRGASWWRAGRFGPNWPTTRVPRGFDLRVGGQAYTVHPNATKHMAEYAAGRVAAGQSALGEFPISSLAGAVGAAQTRGLQAGRNFVTVGNWELGIDTTQNVVYHAVYRP